MAEGKNLVGVDIGSASIKVCQVKDTKKGIGLLRLGYAPLAPSVIVDGQVMDGGAVTEALAKVFHDAKIKQRECALSVSGQSVIIRKISVPMMTEAELAEQIQWQRQVEADYLRYRRLYRTKPVRVLARAPARPDHRRDQRGR